MDATSIRDGWLVIGKSRKAAKGLTEIHKRVPVGDKGLGRLAALRLGTVAELRSRPKATPGKEYSVRIDWHDFDKVATVEEVGLTVEEASTAQSNGTSIRVANLRQPIMHRDAERIARSLLLLANPFQHTSGFSPKLLAHEYPELVRKVDEGYFEESSLRLEASLNNEGEATAVVRDKAGCELFRASADQVSTTRYDCPPAEFKLWEFDLSGKSFAPTVSPVEIREWLRIYGGVHIYIRDLRVPPYGDPRIDWLEMNLARVRSPELRPSTNNSVGRILITEQDDRLTQKTDRSGFIEDDSFSELRRFATDVLDWMATERVRERDKNRQAQRQSTPKRIAAARTAVSSAISDLPESDRKRVEAAVSKLDRVRDEEAQGLRDELQLYRTLATVGTTSAVFAHESAQPVTRIERSANQVERIATAADALFDRQIVADLAAVIKRAAISLRSFAALPLKLLQREKRKRGPMTVHAVIRDGAQLFEPFLKERSIVLDLELDCDREPVIVSSVAALESVLANLITNAAYALIYHSKKDEKRIVIRTLVQEKHLAVTVQDNGPGIAGISADDIWLPGKSTRKGGTGLGLTIVKDTIADLGGEVRAVSPGELGGTDFLLMLPLQEQR